MNGGRSFRFDGRRLLEAPDVQGAKPAANDQNPVGIAGLCAGFDAGAVFEFEVPGRTRRETDRNSKFTAPEHIPIRLTCISASVHRNVL